MGSTSTARPTSEAPEPATGAAAAAATEKDLTPLGEVAFGWGEWENGR